jgi:hypothetical protein
MSIGAAVVAVAVALVAYVVGDPGMLLSGLAEVAAVVGLFALVCAAEAWN